MSKEPNIEDVLNTFIDKIKAGVVVHDNNTKLIRCNKKSLNLLGLTEKQLIGKDAIDPIWKFLNEDGSVMPLENYPVKQVVTNRKELKDFVAGIYRTKTNDIVWVLVSAVPEFNSDGDIIQVIVTFMDITEKKRTKKALRESEERLRSFYDAGFEGIAITDQGKFVDVNNRFCELYGYNREELIGSEVMNLVAEEDRELVLSNIRSGYVNPYEFRSVHKDGSEVIVEVHGQQINYHGRSVRVTAVHDITERKRAEEVLHKYKRIVSSSSDHLALLDKNYIYQMVNDAYLKAQNKRREDIVGHSVSELFGQEFFEKNQKPNIDRCLAGETVAYEMWVKLPFLGQRCMAVIHYPYYEDDGSISGYVVNARDITDYKLAEEKLMKSEDRYRMLFNSTNDAVFVHQPSTTGKPRKFIEVNDIACKMYGYTKEELLELTPSDLLIPEHKEKARDFIKRLLSKGHNVFEIDHKTKDGKKFPVEISAFLFDFHGTPTVLSIARDIAERKLTEDNLRENKEKYRLLFEMESDAIILIRQGDGQILEVNVAGQNLYGYTREELLKMKNTDLSAEPEETRKATLEGRQKIPLLYHRKKDGKVFPVEISGNQLSWKGQNARITTIRDISKRIEADKAKANLEAQLQQAQKMEAIGTLAGGIAHDFNNILSPILMHIEMAMMDIPQENPIQHSLKEVLNAGGRARDLVKQIFTFSRQREQESANLKIGSIVKEVLKFLRSTLPTTIKIEQKINTESDTVNADPTQIHQVIMNLCTNAAHAMKEKGGKLKVNLDETYLDSEDVEQFSDLSPGYYLTLSVEDSGCGIDNLVIENIFEPYFTTSEKGEGTGMGLAVVHGIVKDCGGDITVKSKLGKGTTFHVWLPKVDIKTLLEPEQKVEIPKGTEKILFVDDEKGFIDVVQQMLDRLGYKVTARTSSIEALEAFRNKPDAFDLIITDLTMPNMTGIELAKEIMKIHPSIPIVLCTGFSDQISESKAKEIGIRAFVMKPIDMSMIAKVIRDVLDNNE
ncbi:hypothetical protein C6A37_04535 [Desulfobacteraceae bacterium SEEP-SAG9]|nr:hypothetical protein C6A37_04535 [Desulfobacteraceae bacterium SEEP-SAG9]